MSRWFTAISASALLMFMSGVAHPHAERRGLTFAVTMTNDASANQIKVYDAESHALLQTLSTRGTGGVGGNARGVRQFGGRSSQPSTMAPTPWRYFNGRATA